MKDFWDSRYEESGFAYGKEPNLFLKAESHRFRPQSKILCLSEGEGRNAIYLAHLGHDVTAVDISAVGLNKASERAKQENVKLNIQVADLNDYDMGENNWDAIVSIFGHLPEELRQKVHGNIFKALRSGGYFLMEGYTPEQLLFKTGGPKNENLLLTLEGVTSSLRALTPLIKRTCIRDVQEGRYHTGLSAVLQYVGQKPGAA